MFVRAVYCVVGWLLCGPAVYSMVGRCTVC